MKREREVPLKQCHLVQIVNTVPSSAPHKPWSVEDCPSGKDGSSNIPKLHVINLSNIICNNLIVKKMIKYTSIIYTNKIKHFKFC